MPIRFNDSYIISLDLEYESEGVCKLIDFKSGLHSIKQSKYGYYHIYPIPELEELNDYYANNYYQNPHGTYMLEYSKDELIRIELRNKLAVNAIRPLVPSKSVLDVGCGEGFMLKALIESDFQATGLDFSNFGILKHNPELSSYFRKGNIYNLIRELSLGNVKYGAVNLGNVLEHVRDPEELIEQVWEILEDEGVLLITVPNDFSELQMLYKSKGLIEEDYWVAPPDHLNYFNRKSLSNLVEAKGFSEVLSYGDFPIEFFLGNPQSNYVKNKELGKGAHEARVLIENLINAKNNLCDVMDFWSALGKLGLGRTLTSIYTKRKR